MQLLAGLAADAAGLLWELAAMQDTGDAATDMMAKSEQLQVCRVSMSWTVQWYSVIFNKQGFQIHEHMLV